MSKNSAKSNYLQLMGWLKTQKTVPKPYTSAPKIERKFNEIYK